MYANRIVFLVNVVVKIHYYWKIGEKCNREKELISRWYLDDSNVSQDQIASNNLCKNRILKKNLIQRIHKIQCPKQKIQLIEEEATVDHLNRLKDN